MRTKKEVQNKAEELAKEFLAVQADNPAKILIELLKKMAEFAVTKTQTAEQRHYENWKAYHRVAGE